jgi:BA14K-like protein
MLRRFIIAIATVAALGISFSSTDASAQKGGGVGHARIGGSSGTHMGGAGIAPRGNTYRGAGIAPRGNTYRGAGIAPRGNTYRGGYGGRYYGGGYGGGWGYYGGGFAAGAIVGGLLAAPYYDGYGYDGYGYGYGYGYEAPVDDSAVAYCVQRFRSYDPASGTYLGNDGYRHPCP